MKSNNFKLKNFSTILSIGILVPQILALAMVFIEPLGKVFFETDMLTTTASLFLIYYVAFAVVMGIKSYKYTNKTATAIAQFVLWNFYHSLFFLVVAYLFVKFLLSDDASMGLLLIFLGYIVLVIVSVLIFSITCFCTKIAMKNKNVIDKVSEEENN